jgi:hypothetical protein
MTASAPDGRLSDAIPLLDNAAGPKTFRVERPPARLCTDGPGTLKSWNGNAFDAGETFAGTDTIIAPGLYELTLDGAGYATIQESQS